MATHADLIRALTDLLVLAEEHCDWALEGEPCDPFGDSICSQCRKTGCARLKIDEARAVIAKTSAPRRVSDRDGSAGSGSGIG